MSSEAGWWICDNSLYKANFAYAWNSIIKCFYANYFKVSTNSQCLEPALKLDLQDMPRLALLSNSLTGKIGHSPAQAPSVAPHCLHDINNLPLLLNLPWSIPIQLFTFLCLVPLRMPSLSNTRYIGFPEKSISVFFHLRTFAHPLPTVWNFFLISICQNPICYSRPSSNATSSMKSSL